MSSNPYYIIFQRSCPLDHRSFSAGSLVVNNRIVGLTEEQVRMAVCDMPWCVVARWHYTSLRQHGCGDMYVFVKEQAYVRMHK